MINNVKKIFKQDTLSQSYYECSLNEGKFLLLAGFIPISVDTIESTCLFYKDEKLFKYLKQTGGDFSYE